MKYPLIYAPVNIRERPQPDLLTVQEFCLDFSDSRCGEWFIKDDVEPLRNRYVFTEDELIGKYAELIETWSDGKVTSNGAKSYAKELVNQLKSQP